MACIVVLLHNAFAAVSDSYLPQVWNSKTLKICQCIRWPGRRVHATCVVTCPAWLAVGMSDGSISVYQPVATTEGA